MYEQTYFNERRPMELFVPPEARCAIRLQPVSAGPLVTAQEADGGADVPYEAVVFGPESAAGDPPPRTERGDGGEPPTDWPPTAEVADEPGGFLPLVSGETVLAVAGERREPDFFPSIYDRLLREQPALVRLVTRYMETRVDSVAEASKMAEVLALVYRALESQIQNDQMNKEFE